MRSGVLNLLKPPGMTSSDAVLAVRRLFGQKRVGHTGTLDPGAAGVLPICLGRATRLFDYLVEKDKTYLAEIHFGAETDTLDSYGRILAEGDYRVPAEALKALLPAFLGEQEQRAPMYSALKSGGKKLYELARAGAPAVEKRRQICIYSLSLLEQTGPGAFLLEIRCSRGTYVRSLCRDLGQALGVPAYLSFLLRSQSGAFCLEEAHTLEELQAHKEAGSLDTLLISPEKALAHLKDVRLVLDRKDRLHLYNGAPVQFPGWEALPKGEPLRTYVQGQFWGLSAARETGLQMCLFLQDEENMGHG